MNGSMKPFISLFTRRELLWQFLVRNVKSRHRGSILGAFWLVANPLLMLGLYVFAFGVVFGGRFKDSPQCRIKIYEPTRRCLLSGMASCA